MQTFTITLFDKNFIIKQDIDGKFILPPELKCWENRGSALKPAWEPIIVAMKPLDGTFAANAEKHGVAGLNIDGGRIGTETRYNQKAGNPTDKDTVAFRAIPNPHNYQGQEVQGRWPANLILDEESAKMLDEQSGTKTSGKMKQHIEGGKFNVYGKQYPRNVETIGDSGGASRFFKVLEPESCFLCGYIEEHGNLEVGPNVYLCDECLISGEALDLPKRFLYCAKASRKERNLGLGNTSGKKVNDGWQTPIDNPYQWGETIRQNTHPTVKPLALMKYLCTLLKMPGQNQIILDPFMGSGTTGMACAELKIGFIGIEKEPEYCKISQKRIAAILGIALPINKNAGVEKATVDSTDGNSRPNLPRISEHRQSIINAASSKLRRNK